MRPFGSTVYVHIHTHHSKLEPRYFKAILMGYRSYSESTIRYFNPVTKEFNFTRDYKFASLGKDGTPLTSSEDDHGMNFRPYRWSSDESPFGSMEPAKFDPLPHADPSQEVVTPDARAQAVPKVPRPERRHDVFEAGEVEAETPTKIVGSKPNFFVAGWQEPQEKKDRTPAADLIDLTEQNDIVELGDNTRILETIPEEEESSFIASIAVLGVKVNSPTSAVVYCMVATDCPSTYQQARKSKDWPYWWPAMKVELRKMDLYGVWVVVKRTPDMRVLHTRWLYTRKIDGMTGRVDAYRARLVVRGFEQIFGLDHQEVYAAVAHKDSIRIFLAIVNFHQLFCDQVDIQAAFLNGPIEEDVYIAPPEGMSVPEGSVLKLRKALYGLKQAPRCFDKVLDGWLKSEGFQPNSADPYLYSYSQGDVFMMLTVHVDDQLIAGNSRSALDAFKSRLNARFPCTDHGEVNYFLGMNIIRDRENRKLWISQEHYVEGVLERFDMSNSFKTKTPLPSSFKARAATDEEHAEVAHLPYPSIVGSIMYAATISRPDLAFPANLLARYISKWNAEHYRAAKHLLRYLRGTSDLCLLFDADSSQRTVSGYVDADWGGCADTYRSTTGYLFKVHGSLVAWKSRRQSTFALSTTEAELMAEVDAAKQAT
jgi:hypothetical protein